MTGMFWYIIVDQASLFWYDTDDFEVNYFTSFELFAVDENTNKHVGLRTKPELALQSMYYGMTTLTTVGFGDFYPITDFERSIGVIFLFGGVIIMSYTQGVFLEGIESIQALNAEIEE